MLKLNKIEYSNSGQKVNYLYDYTPDIAKYFNKKEPLFTKYESDISRIPESIAVIPFLANVMPIAWFVGFDVHVNEVDDVFYQSLEIIKEEFSRNFPQIDVSKSNLVAKKKVKNQYHIDKTAMLFSGGVDAYTTYFRNKSSGLDLITVWGADVDLDDEKQWNRVVKLNEEEKLLKHNNKYYITSNIRDFYTHNVDLLLTDLGWWGKVQHGLALNSLVAPLAYINAYSTVYIASSYTENFKQVWGSTPEIDNNIRWGKTSVIHDGFELKRQDKIKVIVDNLKSLDSDLALRVCYSELNSEVNCSKCEKCHRTIIGIILENGDPNKYGFEISFEVYNDILKNYAQGFASEGTKYFWWEILERIKSTKEIFIFQDKAYESMKMKELEMLIEANMNLKVPKKTQFSKLKFSLQKTFPGLFKIYLKFRQRNK